VDDARRNSRLKPINYFEVYDFSTGAYLGNLVDVSEGGLRVLTDDPMNPGDTHELRLRLPKEILGSNEIIVKTECRWCNECSSPLLAGTFGIGLQIRDLDPETARRIEAFIKSSYFHDWRQLPDYKTADAATTFVN
jgi:hypothetical protein